MGKVLYVITKAEIGGAQKYVLELATAAHKAGWEVAVASESPSYLSKALAHTHIAFHNIPSVQREIDVFKDAKLAWELWRIIRKEKPDVLHLNSSKVGAVGAVIGKLARVKRIIFTAHGFVFNDPRPKWQIAALTLITKFAARFQDIIVCVSEYDRKRALEKHIAPKDKFIVIQNGIDPHTLRLLSRKEARAHFLIDEKEFVVGTIANFYKTKSLDTLVFAALSAHEFPVKFVIIGDGPERKKVEALVEKYKLKKKFLIAGTVPDASLYLKAFDVFALPSKKEGLPYALLEAMSAKLPCIVSGAGGMPEAVENGKSGIVLSPLTRAKLWETIEQLSKHKAHARELGEHASDQIASKFSAEEMVQKTLHTYE